MAPHMRAVPRSIIRSALPTSSRCQHSTRPSRLFHSYDHPNASGPFSAAEKAILSASYNHVPEHGFSQRSLSLGARDAGYLDISPSVLPYGTFSLIQYHLLAQREALSAQSRILLEDQPVRGEVGAKVAVLTWARLLGNRHIINHWQEALAIMAQPSNVPVSLRELAMLSDEIWFLAGDTSVDPSWYTKRAALSMIYSSSELFMTNDESPDFIETNEFLHRRLSDIQALGSKVASLSQWAGFTMNAGINVLRSKGIRI